MCCSEVAADPDCRLLPSWQPLAEHSAAPGCPCPYSILFHCHMSETEGCMCCVRSAEKREQTLAMPAALTVAAGAALSSPLAAQAAVTPSLKNLINSVIAGRLPGSLYTS